MSDTQQDAKATPQETVSAVSPVDGEEITTMDNHMPSEPAAEVITTMDNHMPAPPVLDLDGK